MNATSPSSFPQVERRQQRANNAMQAISLQIAHVAAEVGLPALVLLDGLGRVKAAAGSAADVDALVTQATALHDTQTDTEGLLRTAVDIGAAFPLELVTRGASAAQRDALQRARTGILRICRA